MTSSSFSTIIIFYPFVLEQYHDLGYLSQWQAVRVCLNAGAGLDVQQVEFWFNLKYNFIYWSANTDHFLTFSCSCPQEDKSTALHFACAQGGLNIIHIMRQLQPEKFIIASQKTDILQMTPLHRAALFNHVTVVKFLIDEVGCVIFNLTLYIFSMRWSL